MATYGQKYESQMKTRPLETRSGIPMEGGNTYEGPGKSNAGAGRGAGDNPEARRKKNEDAANGKYRLTTDDKKY